VLRDWSGHYYKRINVTPSLNVTCRRHGVDPYAYLVDVPQRVAEHRAALFDRLLHHTLIAQISGESYRLKEQA
jgi:hypothetical protein